jgi:hypothetical protein
MRPASGDGCAAPLVDLANSQHGVVTHAQLRARLTRNGIARRCARGELHRVYPGVFAVGHTALSREGRWLAAVFAAGEGAALCRKCCAALLEIERWPPRTPQVLVPRSHRPIPGVDLYVTRTLDPRDVTTVKGIPCTTVPRLFIDLSDELIAEELTRYIHEAAFQGVLDLKAVRRAMARANGRHSLDVLESAIEDWLDGSAGIRSRGEGAFRRAVAAAGLPRPHTNRKVVGIEVDFHWPELQLVIEIDGPPHSRPPSRLTDAERDAELRAAGYRVIRCKTPEAAIDRLRDYSTTRFGASPQSCSRR